MSLIEEADAAVMDFLAAASLGLVKAPASGCNLFRGKVRPPGNGVPMSAVFVTLVGGLENTPLLNGGTTSKKQFAVSVRVRADVDEEQTGQELAINIIRALHAKDVPGYAFCVVDEAAPRFLGTGAAGGPEWSIPVRLGVVA